MIVLQKMCVFFLMIIVGFVAKKKGILDEESNRRLSSLVVNIANPALILSSVATDGGTLTREDVLYAFLIACGVYAVLVILGLMIPLLLRVPKEERNTYNIMFVFSNIGFMGFPLMASLFGNEALLIGAAFVMVFNILIYTYGIWLMAPKGEAGKAHWKKIFNPGIIACILAIVLFWFEMPMPVIFSDTIVMLSNLTGPLSMIIIGVSLADLEFRQVAGDVRLWVFSILKLVVCSILGALVVRQFVQSDLIYGVTVVILANPVASMAAMLAQEYHCNERVASSGIALSTLLSVVTIPLVFAVVGA